MAREEGWRLAQQLGLNWDTFDRRFNGTAGSLTIDLSAMKLLYEELRDTSSEQGVKLNRLLDATKLLYVARQPRLREPILRAVIEQVLDFDVLHGGVLAASVWDTLKRETIRLGFGDFSEGEFRTYRPYYEAIDPGHPACVDFEPSQKDLAALLPILDANQDGEGLFYLALATSDTIQQVAERAWSRAGEMGNAIAYYNLAVLLGSIPERESDVETAYQRAIELAPNFGSALGNYALFLKNERQDYDRAEEMYERAIAANPSDASILGNYANFFVTIRHDYDRAEEMYERAIAADPNHANNLGNYAGFLLASGRRQEGRAAFSRALSLALVVNELPLLAELRFYAFVHQLPEARGAALCELRRLLESGVQSPGWDLTRNVERAKSDGHPDRAWLERLARVIGGTDDIGALGEWVTWRNACSSTY